MKNNMDLIVTFAKLWGIYTADNRTNKKTYRELEAYDSEELLELLSVWAEEFIEGEYDDTCDFFETKVSHLIVSSIRSAISAKYPVLHGSTASVTKELHGIQEVADFILEQGRHADVIVTLPDGTLFLDTLRIFINKGIDCEYKAEVMKILLPSQREFLAKFEKKEDNEEKKDGIKEN